MKWVSTPMAVFRDWTKPALCTMPPISTTSPSMPTRRTMAHTRLATASSTALAMSFFGVAEWIRDTTSDSANTVHWAFMGMVLSDNAGWRRQIPLSVICRRVTHGLGERSGAGGTFIACEVDRTTFGVGLHATAFLGTDIHHRAGLGNMKLPPLAPAVILVMPSVANATCLRPAPVANTDVT